MSPAMMKSNEHFARPLSRSPRAATSASGSSTSCTQRGITTRAAGPAATSSSADELGFSSSALGGAACGRSAGDACGSPASRPSARVWLSRGVRRAERSAQRGAGRARRPREILFVGDVVGGLGRHTLLDCLPVLRERHAPTFVVVNGENAAGGLGITPKNADQMFAAGVDAITLGNHTYHRREIYPYLEATSGSCGRRTSCAASPAAGVCVVERDGLRLGRGQHQRQPLPAGGPLGLHRDRGRARRARRGRPRSSSTSTPRRPRRRSRWAGIWTAA